MDRRKQPPQPLKSMTDQELTLDQLHAINGGAAFIKIDHIKGEKCSIVHPEFLPLSKLGICGEKD